MTEGSQNQSFVWGNSLLSASGDGAFYYLQDHLGSPIRLVGEGQSDTPLAYDEFGVPLVESGQNLNNPFGFTGYQADDVSGLYYAQARYYEPGLGRFGAEDILKGFIHFPISLNPYAYCLGNPLGFIDLDGLSSMPPWVEDGNEAHKLLQAHLATIHAPNVQVGGSGIGIPGAGANGGYGFPDVVYRNGNVTEIYEIKPATWSVHGTPQNSAGLAQLQRYINGMPLSENAVAGMSLNASINCFEGNSKLYPGVKIKYFTLPTQPGMVYYWYDKPKPKSIPITVPVPVPEKSPEKNFDYETAGKAALGGAAAVSAGYLIYRGIRMIPSLFPPLWATIPANFAIP